jgi:thiol-disulfide isomerase/thioredoxin
MRRLAPAFVLASALLVAACSPSNLESGIGKFAQAEGREFIPEGEREAAPVVEGTTLEGDTLALADLDGPVLVNFWASWCGPCAREAPHLQAVHQAYGPRGLHVVGVDVKDDVANARTFERDFGITYPSWQDPAAAIAASFGGIGPAALPSTILLDRDHRVAVRLFGAVSGARLAPYLEELVGPPEPVSP